MKRYVKLLFVLLASVGGMTAFAQQGEGNEGAIKQVILAFADAWNKHDVPAMMALNTADVNFRNISSVWWEGSVETARIFAHPAVE